MREACALLRDVASSLAILHSRGLLHRDVSPRNVRCTADGRAKLIDFGAMAPMGVTHDVVGTPPFVPPEALELQALDGRADLYALGVVRLLDARRQLPYPARAMEDFPSSGTDAPRPMWWRRAPGCAVQLVMQLISLEPDARPRTAGEVVERLSAIAGLKLERSRSVAGAYLATPSLVDRQSFHLGPGRGSIRCSIATGMPWSSKATRAPAARARSMPVSPKPSALARSSPEPRPAMPRARTMGSRPRWSRQL